MVDQAVDRAPLLNGDDIGGQLLLPAPLVVGARDNNAPLGVDGLSNGLFKRADVAQEDHPIDVGTTEQRAPASALEVVDAEGETEMVLLPDQLVVHPVENRR